MGDIWDYDQLIRIRRATEKMANRGGPIRSDRFAG